MTKQKSTKKTLLSSVLSLVLCVAMLIGTTFAWFTDSVTSGGNTIQAGNLDIDIQDAAGNSLEGEILDFVAADNRAQSEILWEPGCTYNTEEFYIVNKGDLNLKFKFALSNVTGDVELLEVIDFKAEAKVEWFNFNTGAVSITPAAGETFDLLKGYELDTIFYGVQTFTEYVLEPGEKVGPIVLSGHMQETAGNKYQGLSISGLAVSLVATQATGEEDSFSGVYDENAMYPDEVSNEAELLAALEDGGAVKLVDDVSISEKWTIPADATVGIDLNGNTLSSAISGTSAIVNNGTLIVSGGTIENLVNSERGSHTIENVAGATLIINDGTIGNSDNAGAAVYNTGGYVEINGGTYASKQENTKSDGLCAYTFINTSGTMIINNANVTEPTHGLFGCYDGTIVVNGGNYTLKDDEGTDGLACYLTYTTGEGRVVINGGNFDIQDTRNDRYMFHYDSANNKNYFKNAVTDAGYVTLNGGTYNFDVTTYASGSQVDVNTDGTWTIAPYEVGTATDLVQAISEGKNVALTEDVELTQNVVMSGGVLDGNGNTIDAYDTPSSSDCAITTTGGTVENVTITGDKWSTRGLGAGSSGTHVTSEDLHINNVIIDNVLYAINGSGNGTAKVAVTNSTINGWCSYSNISSFEFENCKLGTGNSWLGYMVVYGNTSFTNCEFEDFWMCADDAVVSGSTITFNNCTYEGADVTAANFTTLFMAEDDWTDFSKLQNCTIIVDGVTVTWN